MASKDLKLENLIISH